jgi:hypothetical protein
MHGRESSFLKWSSEDEKVSVNNNVSQFGGNRIVISEQMGRSKVLNHL